MKTLLQINIGLATTTGDLSPVTVLSTLASLGFRVFRHRVAQSATESTVCALALPPEGWHDALYVASVELRQDCIAAQFPDGSGLLVGPGTRIWGEYNPAYFLPA
jgi:hypothetical protein